MSNGYVWHIEFPEGFPNMKYLNVGRMTNYKELETVIRNSELEFFGAREKYSNIQVKEILDNLPSTVRILSIVYSENLKIPSFITVIYFAGDVLEEWNNKIINPNIEDIYFENLHQQYCDKINLSGIKNLSIKSFVKADGN